MAKTQQHGERLTDPDLLAAVVLHTLVTEGRKGMALPRMAVACERDPNDPADIDEIEAAIKILLDDGLAQCDGELFRPTRPAIRASELSF